MKNCFKKMLLACLLTVSAWLISGCSSGSTVDTNLVINQDLSGARVMDVRIDGSAFSSYFKGDINQLNEAVSAACPPELSWEYANEDGTNMYHVRLDFSSPEDYKKKVESILGSETTLELSAPDTVWANGFRVDEGFTSKELLEFMGEVLSGRGLIDSSYASSLFSLGSTKVTYKDQTYDASSYVNVNEVSFLPLNSIDILTSLEEGGLYSRKVVFNIPAASMDAKGDEIKAFLDGNVTGAATSSWEDTMFGKSMTVEITKVSAGELDAFMKKVLASDLCSVAAEPSQENSSDFSFVTDWAESVNTESFAGNEYGTSEVHYYVQAPPSITVDADYEKGQYLGAFQEEDTYPGYRLLWKDEIASKDTFLIFNKVYRAVKTQVTMEAKSGTTFNRTSDFYLEMPPTEDEQKVILERLSEKAGDTASVSGKAAEDGYIVTVTAKGTDKELESANRALFGDGDMNYSEKKGMWQLKHKNSLSENINYSRFIPDVTEDYTTSYTVNMGFLSSIDKKSVTADSMEEPEVKGGTLTMTMDSPYVSVRFSGSRFHIVGLLLWLAVLVILAAAVLAVRKTGVLKKAEGLKEISQEFIKAPVMPEFDEAAVTDEQETGRTYYCQNCGHPYTDGNYCENCGEKLDN